MLPRISSPPPRCCESWGQVHSAMRENVGGALSLHPTRPGEPALLPLRMRRPLRYLLTGGGAAPYGLRRPDVTPTTDFAPVSRASVFRPSENQKLTRISDAIVTCAPLEVTSHRGDPGGQDGGTEVGGRLPTAHWSGLDVLGRSQCARRAKKQRHHHHQAGSRSAKIDPLMAAFNAIALMSTNPWSSPCAKHRATAAVALYRQIRLSARSERWRGDCVPPLATS